jgi:hypothetical protein
MGEATDDYEAYTQNSVFETALAGPSQGRGVLRRIIYLQDGRSLMIDKQRHGYLKFLRDVVFGSNPEIRDVQCHKHPSLGRLKRDEVTDLIEIYEGLSELKPTEFEQLKEFTPEQLDRLADEVFNQEQQAQFNTMQFEYKETKMKSAEWYQEQAEKLMEQARLIENVPQEDIFEDGHVVTFQKSFGNRQGGSFYRYAAVKTELGWSVSGQRNVGKIITWAELLEFIGFDGLESLSVASQFVPIKEYVKAEELAQQQLKATDVADA